MAGARGLREGFCWCSEVDVSTEVWMGVGEYRPDIGGMDLHGFVTSFKLDHLIQVGIIPSRIQ